ncbi:MAG: hypothetical protein GY714_04560 [Desulfobacterales bacterium]|nr:hypothetical protein [Desulfobacterales bacterium]MCP4164000.1 hypothetical protein [Deltaproteobacteria bacterium]
MKKLLLFITTTLFITMFAVNSFALEAEVDIHGFISQGYLKTSDYNFFGNTEEGTAQFNEIGLNISTEFTDELRVGAQIFSKDFGSYGDNEVIVDWAFADYRAADWAGVRAGKIKTPHGLYNETRDVDMLRTSVLLPQSVYSEVLRDVNMSMHGVGFYGEFDMASAGSLSYQIIGGTQDVEGDTTSQAMYIMGLSSTSYTTDLQGDEIDVDKKYVVGLVWDTPLDGLRFGFTYDNTELSIKGTVLNTLPTLIPAGSTISADINKLQNIVISLEYTIDDFQIFGEYKRTDKEFDYTITSSGGTLLKQARVEDDTYGWYVGTSYRINDLLVIGAYYSETKGAEEDTTGVTIDPEHRTYLKDTCVSTKFDITDNIIVKLEGHYIQGTEILSAFDQETDNTWSKDEWGMFACKFTYSF